MSETSTMAWWREVNERYKGAQSQFLRFFPVPGLNHCGGGAGTGEFDALAALVAAFLACPISVFGGANLGCVGHAGFEGNCANTMIFMSPLILIAGGAVPEPAGWAMMIVGLGAIGAAMRGQRRSLASAA